MVDEAGPRVTLYTKPDCHLCHDLKRDLLTLRQEVAFLLTEQNIEESDEMFARYRYLIPVLEIEGGPLLYPPHSRDDVRMALIAARAQAC